MKIGEAEHPRLSERGSLSQMPEGWIFCSLGALLQLRYGKGLPGPKRRPGRVPVFGSNGVVGHHDEALTRGPTIIVGRKGTVGAIHLSPYPCWPIDTTYFVDDFKGLAPEFVAYALKSLDLEALDTSTAVPGLNRNDVYRMEIPVPPLAEQKRIVAQIEDLLIRIDAAKEHFARVPGILRRFRQSVLDGASSGRLTVDWRERRGKLEPASSLFEGLRKSHSAMRVPVRENAAAPSSNVHTLTEDDLPESWELVELKWLCEPGRPITYGILKPGPHDPTGVPYVRVADYPGDRLDLSGIRRTSSVIAEQYRRSTLRAGDVLLSIRGTVGRVCLVPGELEGANITQDTARISVHADASADYVALYLRCPSAQRRLEIAKKGVAVRGVNIGDVRALQVALPCRTEQEEIVARAGTLLGFADAIEKRLLSTNARVENLTGAVLAKAFRGELVPTEAELARIQNREYEPASALLSRTGISSD